MIFVDLIVTEPARIVINLLDSWITLSLHKYWLPLFNLLRGELINNFNLLNKKLKSYSLLITNHYEKGNR